MASYTLGPGIDGIWFEETVDPYRPMADIAIANLGAIVWSAFVGGATPTAGWTAVLGESLPQFKDRIRADLAAEATTGVAVSRYWRGGFWNRKSTCNPAALLSVG